MPAGKAAKPKRPEPLELVIPNVSPEVEKFLKDWELRTAQIKTMTGSFTRWKYDHTFEVVKQAEGSFAYAAPDKGNYELRKAPVEKGETITPNGRPRPYAVKPDEPERWVCTGKEVIRIDDKAKTYEKVSIPPESQGQNIIDGPLPFLFGMKADRAKKRYRDFKLLKNDDSEIRLELRSFDKEDAKNWDTAIIRIDPKTFTPIAVKLVDTSGAESVHLFSDIAINAKPKGGPFAVIFPGKDPFKPDLRSPYKEVMQDRPNPAAANEKPIAPRNSKQTKATPANGRASAGNSSDSDVGRSADSAGTNAGKANSSSR